ncbi:hypothetical protein GCM10010360_44990 [Streptomyces nogalater]
MSILVHPAGPERRAQAMTSWTLAIGLVGLTVLAAPLVPLGHRPSVHPPRPTPTTPTTQDRVA